MDLKILLDEHPMQIYIREAEVAYRSPWRVPERRLLDYLLVYVQDGHCVFHVEDKEYPLEPGMFCLIQPREHCILRGLDQTVTPFMHFDIFYNPLRKESFPTKPGQIDLSRLMHLMQPKLNDIDNVNIPTVFSPPNLSLFRNTMISMIHHWRNPHPLDQIEASNLGTQLIVALLRMYGHWDTSSSSTNTLNWIPSYLSLHLADDLSVEDMANRARLSTSRFSALFRVQFGEPPHRYFMQMRIQHAVELLKNPLLTLEDVAQYCGFNDTSHFCKIFKKTTGQTPRSFRS